MFNRHHAEQRLLKMIEDAKSSSVEPPTDVEPQSEPEASRPIAFHSEIDDVARPENL